MKSFLFLLLSFQITSIFSQIQFGPKHFFNKKELEEFKQIDLERLKKTETYFVYIDKEEPLIKEFEKELSEVWEYTEIEFISYNEFRNMDLKENQSFFSLELNLIDDHIITYFRLWMFKDGKPFTMMRKPIDISTNNIRKLHYAYYGTLNIEKRDEVAYNMVYSTIQFYNFDLGQIKNILQYTQTKFDTKDIPIKMSNKKYSHPQINKLQNDTLYIPDYFLIKFLGYSLREDTSSYKRWKIPSITEDYRFPFRFVSDSVLNELILHSNEDEPIFYVSISRVEHYRHWNVIDSSNGDIIFNQYSHAFIYVQKPKRMLRKIKKSID